MIKYLLLIFCLTFSFNNFAQIFKVKINKTFKHKSTSISTKGFTDSEKEIMSFSKGKKSRAGFKKDKKGRIVKTKTKAVVKYKPTLMYSPIVSNGKSLTGNISSRQGFRICIFNGSNRDEAFKTKQEFAKSETKLRSYLVYSRPNYKIKVGDMDNKKIAAKELKRLIQKYPSSFITPDIVTIKNFEVHSAKGRRRK